jgi:hypothetical protein
VYLAYLYPIELIYDETGLAAAATHALRTALERDEPLAQTLRRQFSLDNMEAFLHRYLLTDGLVALERPALLTVDRLNGVREDFGNGRYAPAHIENIASPRSHLRWQRVSKATWKSTFHGRFAMRCFGLNPRYAWRTLTHIADPEELDLLRSRCAHGSEEA